jgi:hypothetical protein
MPHGKGELHFGLSYVSVELSLSCKGEIQVIQQGGVAKPTISDNVVEMRWKLLPFDPKVRLWGLRPPNIPVVTH